MPRKTKSPSRYSAILEQIFFKKYKNDAKEFEFERVDISEAVQKLKIDNPKNFGDVIYSARYRGSMPQRILNTQPKDKEWIIEGRGKAKYAFKLVSINLIVPNPQLMGIKIPDATPEIVSAYALSDEQALLAKVRYNRLIDVFMGLAAYSLQNHLRTTVLEIGQVEIDEIYVGVDRNGRQFVLPVQAKGGTDRLSVVQTKQDISCCEEKYPDLICRAISAQFMKKNLIALFELTLQNDEVRIIDEKHYQLVPADEIGADELAKYAQSS